MRGEAEQDDPEAIADLQLRAKTERERPKTDGAVWIPPRIVAQWPCRGCGAEVEVTDEGARALDAFNASLAARGERPLSTQAIAWCAQCASRAAAARAAANAQQNARIAIAVRELRATRHGTERWTGLLRDLTALGHPDVKALAKAIQETQQGRRGKDDNL